MTNPETSKSQQVDGGPGTHNTGSDEPIETCRIARLGRLTQTPIPPSAIQPMTLATGVSAPSHPRRPKLSVPPYEGRQTSAKDIDHADDPGTGGASRPEKDSEYRSPKPQDTPGGATASPADEQPASQGSETEQ